MDNREIAKVFRETAHLLEIDGAIIGRYRSYEKAADLIEGLHDSVEQLAQDEKKLMELPGIGKGMCEHIQEVLKAGDYSLRQKLLKKYPATILDLLAVQSLGPKKIALLWSAFHCAGLADLEKLATAGKLKDLPGFGEKSEQNILKALAALKTGAGRHLIIAADKAAEKLSAYIKLAGSAVESITPAGSLRRGKETIGDLDLLVSLTPGQDKQKHVDAIADHIVKFPSIRQLLARGENKVSFLLEDGMQVDVRLLQKKCFGAALMYFTGSKEHNVALRGRANDAGWTLNEYALTAIKGGRVIAQETEEEIYAKLKLPYIPPELRENTGEIEAAELGKLPDLIQLKDIRGDLQMHTTASDGKNTIEAMAEAARELGYEYIALTDHSKAVTVANGLDDKRTLAQIKKIRTAEKKSGGIRLLASAEVDILKDGTLDLSDDTLAQLDVVVASIHSYMNLDRAAMTERLLAAIEHPCVDIIAHPTGRLLLRRESYDYDMEKILDAAKKHGVAMEINAYPDRLDLKDTQARLAKSKGVKLVISTDSHSTGNLRYMKYGVTTARRAWLERKDVLNALPLPELLGALRSKRHHAHAASAQAR